MSAPVSCADDRRRADARAAGRNGLDSISVSVDQLTLTVMLFGKAPEDLRPENFRIDGGRRVTGIRVVGVALCIDTDPELLDCVRLTVDRPGDYSVYRLCIVEAEAHGGPGTRPYRGFDPRYACLDFSFKQNCDQLLDCAATDRCPPPAYPEPEIDHLAKDYASFRQLLLERLSLTMPAWSERHVPDVGIALVELLAYVGDRLSYRQDAAATEAYLDTARLRVSVRRHARLVDYPMHDGCAARAWVCLETTEQVTLPAGDFRFATLPHSMPAAGGSALLAEELQKPGVPPFEIFGPVQAEDVTLYPPHNRIGLWTWGDHDCCLPAGATAATLVDGAPRPDPCTEAETQTQPEAESRHPAERVLHLRAGDVLVFREVLGPKTGVPADADPAHCQAVRLTSVMPAVDELYRQPVLEVTWSREDALDFPLCVNARGGADCTDLEVGVAHGNVVLAEHGRDLTWCHGAPEVHQAPARPPGTPGCPDTEEFGCGHTDPAELPPYPPIEPRFAPTLRHRPVTQSPPFPAPAALARAQAEQLLGVPGRARDRLRALVREHRPDTPLPDPDFAYLTTLFGAATLAAVGLRRHHRHPRRGLRTLLARFDELLATKLRRLTELVRRARAGYVLDAGDEGWEIEQSWGTAEGDDLRPERPAFRGPARYAARPDPHAALPALTATVDTLGGAPWLPRRDLLGSGPTDRHVVGEVDDDGALTLRFGDGRAGVAPPPGSALRVSYRVGNGPAGNVGRDAINRVVFCSTRQGGITRVWNPLPATGGTDPEPVAEVRQRAPHEIRRRLLRAITAEDYAALAGQVPGVQRAAADLRWTGSWYEVQVAVDPVGAETAPDWLLDAVREALYPYRRIGHDLSVHSAVLVPLRLELNVQVQPDHIAGHVRAALLEVLGAGRLPDGTLGFFHPDNLSFGTPVRVSPIVAVAAAVPGVRHVEVTRLEPLFGAAGTAVEDGLLRLRPLEVAQLDNDPTRPENGLLTLQLGGGR